MFSKLGFLKLNFLSIYISAQKHIQVNIENQHFCKRTSIVTVSDSV